MTDSRQRAGWPSASRPNDEVWGPATATYSSGRPASAPRPPAPRPSSDRSANGYPAQQRSAPSPRRPSPAAGSGERDEWIPAGPVSREKERANRLMERRLQQMQAAQPRERGLPGWVALLVLIMIAALGGVIDTIGSIQVRGGFNIGIVVASVVAILLVRRSHMFPIVIAPPIVYSLGAVFQLYLRSGGLHDKKVVLDAAANYLVYGFPAIAAATAAVLIVAGIRLIARR